MKISTKEKEIRAYVMNYLEQLEYKKMLKDLDKILESTANLIIFLFMKGEKILEKLNY